MTENRLHADPGVEPEEPPGDRSVRLTETAQQRDRALTIFERSQPGRRAFVAPELDVPERDGLLPDRFRRTEPAKLPEIAEPEIVRHYNRLSKRNFDLDTGFYPHSGEDHRVAGGPLGCFLQVGVSGVAAVLGGRLRVIRQERNPWLTTGCGAAPEAAGSTDTAPKATHDTLPDFTLSRKPTRPHMWKGCEPVRHRIHTRLTGLPAPVISAQRHPSSTVGGARRMPRGRA